MAEQSVGAGASPDCTDDPGGDCRCSHLAYIPVVYMKTDKRLGTGAFSVWIYRVNRVKMMKSRKRGTSMYESLGQVREEALCCRKCALADTRKHVVFGEGDLHAKLMFIGEGPGATEDETGRPFVGPAGQLLDKMLAAIDLRRDQVYIANIVKCRPPGNADPRPEYAEQCIGYLREQVRFIHPKVIVLLGRIAVQNLLKIQSGIGRIHGQVFERKGFLFVPTYHPSALLRAPELKRAAWEDFKTIRRLLEETDA